MTVFVKESSESILSGLSKMKAAMIEDYESWNHVAADAPHDEIRARMNKEYAAGFEVKHGSKYIKLLTKNGDCVTAFIVGVDTDKKFRKGDILMPAGWVAPARNGARGNVLDGGYPINWTGPLYLRVPGQLLR
jgi:hypothetical protein